MVCAVLDARGMYRCWVTGAHHTTRVELEAWQHLARKLWRFHHDDGLEDLMGGKDGAVLLCVDLLGPAACREP